ncbi:shikimate kinase [Pigmentiphaga litoralis]|nr:shikimate kinase [Pigmentiphaga litoralis]
MMGAGKTTIGRGLARAMGREFVDIDQVIETRCGVRIPTIFELEGEAGFRAREAHVLDEYSRKSGVVLATGGGVVMAEPNRRILAERGRVLYLRARAEELYQRTRYDRNRPLLRTADPLAKITELLVAREPLYEEIADLVVDTGRMSVTRLVHRILPLLLSCDKPITPVSDLPPLECL